MTELSAAPPRRRSPRIRRAALEVRARTGSNVEVPIDADAFDLDRRQLHVYFRSITAEPTGGHAQQRLADLAAAYACVQGHDLDALSVWRVEDRDAPWPGGRERMAVWQP